MNLNLCVDMRGCPNRCLHCWVGHMPNGNLSDRQAEEIVQAFGKFYKKITFYSWLREPDYFTDYRRRWAADCALSTGEKPQRFELASFYKIVREPDYVQFLKEVGTEKVQLTLFGMEEMTDRYVGRKGAFAEVLEATEILLANSIAPRWQFFINQENKEELVRLLTLTDEKKYRERCPAFSLFIHEGSCDGENAKLYDRRICRADIPEQLLPYYLDLDQKESEAALIQKLSRQTDRFFQPIKDTHKNTLYISGKLDVFFNLTHMRPEWIIGNLVTDGINEIHRRIEQNDTFALRSAANISVAELAARYGNPASQRLFEESDYCLYLLNRHLETTFSG